MMEFMCALFLFSDFNMFGVVRGMLVGVKLPENTSQGIVVALLRWIWNARLAASISTGCGQRLWESAHFYVETDYAVVCSEIVSAGHPL